MNLAEARERVLRWAPSLVRGQAEMDLEAFEKLARADEINRVRASDEAGANMGREP